MEPLIINNAVPLDSLAFSKSVRLPMLAPHPDDFDAIGVSMRFFHWSFLELANSRIF